MVKHRRGAKNARHELILKLCTISFVRWAHSSSGSHIRFISPQIIQYVSQATFLGTALNRLGTPGSDTNITQIIETVSQHRLVGCGYRHAHSTLAQTYRPHATANTASQHHSPNCQRCGGRTPATVSGINDGINGVLGTCAHGKRIITTT